MVDGGFGVHGQTAQSRVEEDHSCAIVVAIILKQHMVEKTAMEKAQKHNDAELNLVQVS